MKITITSKKEIITNSLEETLIKIAEDFGSNVDLTTHHEYKEITATDKKSRIRDTIRCIKEVEDCKDYKSFILSLKSWTADVYPEESLLNNDEIAQTSFIYLFGNIEKLYKIVVNDDNNRLNYRITNLNKDLYKKIVESKLKDTISA